MVTRDAERSESGPLLAEDHVLFTAYPDADDATSRMHHTLSRLGAPTMPLGPLAQLLRASPQDPDQVIAALRQNPVLAARVLAAVNSAACGLSRKIAAIDLAVNLLGGARARTLGLAYGLRAVMESASLPRQTLELLWANSLQKGCAAKLFCALHEPTQADAAFCLGLIQDIGLPMLMAVDPDYYQSQIIPQTQQRTWSEHETEHFGIDHAAVGQGLLLEWQASEDLQQIVLRHHAPPVHSLGADAASMLDLGCFLASLLPHLDEMASPAQAEWLHALFVRFLSDHYASPDAFLRAVHDEAQRLRTSQSPELLPSPEQLVRQLVDQVACDTTNVTTRLCRLEANIRRQQEGISDLKFQAFTDPLTKVLNRRGFAQLGQRRLELAADQGLGVCCMLSDLDDFKQINDAYGHDVGDQVLRGLAKMMRRHLKANDLIGRIGGDEFAAFIIGVTQEEAHQLTRGMVQCIEGVRIRARHDVVVQLHLSLGAVFCNQDLSRTRIDELLVQADQAMYLRKHNGKRGLTFQVLSSAADAGHDHNPDSKIRQQPREAG